MKKEFNRIAVFLLALLTIVSFMGIVSCSSYKPLTYRCHTYKDVNKSKTDYPKVSKKNQFNPYKKYR